MKRPTKATGPRLEIEGHRSFLSSSRVQMGKHIQVHFFASNLERTIHQLQARALALNKLCRLEQG